MNLAMANSTGIAHFSRECTSEQCALDVASQHNYDLIYTSTVDAFLRKHEIDYVDVLKVRGGRGDCHAGWGSGWLFTQGRQQGGGCEGGSAGRVLWWWWWWWWVLAACLRGMVAWPAV